MSAHVTTVQPTFAEIAPRLQAPALQARVDDLIRHYPSPQAALLQVLWLAQHELGWLPNAAMEWAAKQCKTSAVHAYGVATFYTMYLKAPTGKFLLQICQNVTCHALGAENILAHAEKTLGIPADGAHTTADGLFTMLRVECLGACGNGPVMQVNDDFATDVVNGIVTMPQGVALTTERFDRIVAWCRANKDKGLVRDPLGGQVKGDLGHPGAVGASAVAQAKDYAPPPPALGLKAEIREGAGVVLTWRVAPEVTEIGVEADTGNGVFTSVGTAGPKDKEFVHATGVAGIAYRLVAVSGSRIAKPSSIVKVGG